MPLHQTEAFVLRSHPVGESDRLVTFLTRSAGKVRGVAKGARRSRRRFGSSLELLSRVRLSYFEKEGRDLARVEGAELLESFFDLQGDPERGAVLACFAEVADAFAREEQPDEAFFRLLHAVLGALRAGLGLGWASRYFEIWTLRLHGFLPELHACSRCGVDLRARGGRYGPREEGLLCGRCRRDDRPGDVLLAPPALRAAAEILAAPPVAFAGRPDDAPALEPLAALAEAIFTDVVERRFKSYDVLRSLRRGPARAGR